MDPRRPTVEAVAVRGETIVAAGPIDEVMALEGPSTRVVDLGDNALLPASSTPTATSWERAATRCCWWGCTRRRWET